MRRTALLACLAFLAAAFLAPAVLHAQTTQPAKRLLSPEKRIAELEKEAEVLKRDVTFLRMAPVPERVVLCDRAIPLSSPEAREGFEREFYNFLDNRGLLTVLVKRYAKFFDVVSGEIDRMAMPPDLHLSVHSGKLSQS